jgi:predicted DsbA family dithiol-disulfide isomerase
MDLFVYGDFNCPYSALASRRVDDLLQRGIDVRVEFRAVEHRDDIPADGEPMTGARAAKMAEELEEVRAQLLPGELFDFRVPATLSNTGPAIAAYASAPPEDRPALRRAFFRSLWVEDRDISWVASLSDLGAPAADAVGEAAAAQWREEWDDADGAVPALRLPDGVMVSGLDALGRLGELVDARTLSR